MKDNDLITVCDACKQARCWQGVFLCDKAQTAVIIHLTVAELRMLKLEDESYWKTDEELQQEYEKAKAVKPKGDNRYLALLDELRTLHESKSADYGKGQDALANLRGCEAIGVPAHKGAWIRLLDKVHRINAWYSNGTLKNEGVRDSLMDLAAYALLTVVLMEEGK
jgi:hypothetical protein